MGGPMDAECRNTHGDRHPSAKVLRQTLHDQLTQSPYTDTMEMGMSGSTGSLFKVRIASLGYVILAKAAKHAARDALHREERIYKNYLRPAQEIGVVPPCLGTIDLPTPWVDCETESVLTSCLLLGWVPGLPTYELLAPPRYSTPPLPHQREPARQALVAALGASMRTAFEVVHRLGILHGDAALRNTIVMPGWSTDGARVVLCDFEHAMSCRAWWEKLQKRKARMGQAA